MTRMAGAHDGDISVLVLRSTLPFQHEAEVSGPVGGCTTIVPFYLCLKE